MSDSSDLERRAQARVGRVLEGKWHLERLIGFGGMAAVYSARHRNGARAALKVLHPEIARDQTVRARFLAEGYAANKVEHPGAVRVLDDDTIKEGEDTGSAFLVMELLEGESVLDRVRRLGGILPESDVLAIAEDVLLVLAAAHAKGIVHRDLKPDNLFAARTEDGRERVKVLDFGIARLAESAGRTAVGTTLGTPSYMAPEQARGQRDAIDGRSDLFALGATMFRLLSGRRVHDAQSAAEMLAMMASVPAGSLRTVMPDVRASVAAIVDRALRFERDARYRDADAMLADVRAARVGEALPSGSVPAVQSGAQPFAASQGEPTLSGPPGDPTLTSAGRPSLPTTAQHPAAPYPPARAPAAAPPLAAPPLAASVNAHAPRSNKKRPLGLILGGVVGTLVVIGGAAFFVSRADPAASDAPESEKESDSPKSKAKSEQPSAKPSDDPTDPPDPRETPAVVDAGAITPAKTYKPKTAAPSAKPSGLPTLIFPPGGLKIDPKLGKVPPKASK